MHKIKIVIFFTDTYEDQMSWSLTKFFINCKVPYKCEVLMMFQRYHFSERDKKEGTYY